MISITSFSIVKNSLSVLSSPLLSRRHYVDVTRVERDMMNKYFGEIVSVQPPPPPERINGFMERVTSNYPIITSCYTYDKAWNVKGLLIRGKGTVGTQKRHVILASGIQPQERTTISMNLHIAHMLAMSPLNGVDVTVFPLVNPREYLLHCNSNDMDEMVEGSSSVIHAMRLSSQPGQAEAVYRGVLSRAFQRNRIRRFVSIGVNVHLTKLEIMRAHFPRPCEHDIFGPLSKLIDPPAILIELVDMSQRNMNEELIVQKSEAVIQAIQKILKDTEPNVVL